MPITECRKCSVDNRYKKPQEVAAEGNLNEEIVAIVHDNASNNVVLSSELFEGWSDLPYFGHTLQC